MNQSNLTKPEFPPNSVQVKCYCGGEVTPHEVSNGGCFREIVPKDKEPIRVRYYVNYKGDRDRWLVEGVEITSYTLRYQRLYSYHRDTGVWTRPK